jgi:hypothetical protein
MRSQRATVQLKGTGKATVWATDELDVTARGLGIVEYYGTPHVKKNGSPMAGVVMMGVPQQA